MLPIEQELTMLSLLVLLLQVCVTLASSLKGPQVLFVYDDKLSPLESYTDIVSRLEDDGFQVETADAGSDVSLQTNGVFKYQHVVLLPSKQRRLGSDITGAQLVEFFNAGGDVLAFTSPLGVSEAVRTFLNELGIYPSPKGQELTDHFQSNGESGLDNVVTVKGDQYSLIIPSSDSFKYSGSAALLSNNPKLTPLISAPATSFTKPSKQEDPWTQGQQGFLAAVFQGLNDARVSWVGDSKLVSNEGLKQVDAHSLIQWTFGETNVLRIKNSSHSHVDGTTYQERPYKITDDIHYEATIEQWNGVEWIPFVSDKVQLEVKLLDPYHRLTFTNVSSDGVYSIDFKLPDHHGVFTFQMEFKQPLYTYLEHKDVLSIRHLANDEYPRSWEITSAWVYITSSVVVFTAWFVFVLAFLYLRDETTVTDKKEK